MEGLWKLQLNLEITQKNKILQSIFYLLIIINFIEKFLFESSYLAILLLIPLFWNFTLPQKLTVAIFSKGGLKYLLNPYQRFVISRNKLLLTSEDENISSVIRITHNLIITISHLALELFLSFIYFTLILVLIKSIIQAV